MSDWMNAIAVGYCLLGVAVILILHHWYKHRPGTPEQLDYPDRCFQDSDVMNFHSCSHEMWILGLLAGSMSMFVVGLVLRITEQ